MSTEQKSLSIYFDKRMLRILLLGIISGFPWVIIGSSLSLWLKEDGISRSAVGWAGLIFSVYAINFLWAPLIDKIKIPKLTNLIGHRKSWILTMQIIILISLIFWSFLDPTTNLTLIIFFGLIIAISSASQDITIDALRIEQIKTHERSLMAAGASIAVVGWWSGYKIGGMLSLFTAEFLQNIGFTNYWQLTFIFICFIILLCNLFLLLIPEKKRVAIDNINDSNWSIKNIQESLKNIIIDPLFSYFKKNGIKIGILIIGFIFLFKIGEAFLGRMSIIFYQEI